MTSTATTSSDPSGVGYDRASPSLFLIEGLLGYLPRATTERVLIDLRALATPSSRLAAAFPIAPKDRARVKRLRHRLRRLVVAAPRRALAHPILDREIDDVFAKTGWQVSIGADTPQRHEGHRGLLLIGEPAAPA